MNAIGAAGAKDLASALKENTTLASLDLRGARLGCVFSMRLDCVCIWVCVWCLLWYCGLGVALVVCVRVCRRVCASSGVCWGLGGSLHAVYVVWRCV